ncbi:polyprenyl synthetase family protein [Bifidobacterium samirii]|uniref:Serralysin n=1 Tax=Bifidobacterium samirii TaxID=2306974 RepID=A0A430FEL7_9BIFI|nr:polyprenyl synthetase family protein [Bifidobacterium samirii]RSX51345.1 serralysin [Bifidobacterium samirii]
MNSDIQLDLIESRIGELVARAIAVPGAGEGDPACGAVMADVARQALVSSEGGKRLRAILALAAFDAAAGAPDARDAMLDLACGIEVFQTAALVHDDIIDDSDLRRGKPAAHKAMAALAGDEAIGRGLGIMLGDLLATASVAIADEAARNLHGADRLTAAFLNMHREVEIGQVLDLAVELASLDDPQRLAAASLDVFRWKTASYTTIAPIELGLIAAGTPADEARRRALAVGGPLGLAFQLADDLLDVVGDSRATGKPVGGDIREGKRTVLLADALEGADAAGRDELRAMFEAPSRDADQVARAIALFESSGAIARSRARIADLWDDTVRAVDAWGLDVAARDALLAVCARFVPSL